nr:MAG TPA: hypothetical protein [Caudoviricetes sp.]
MARRTKRRKVKKIVVHLDDGMLGIALDDNASDREIQKKALEKVLEVTAYQYEEVEEWPKACTLCEWHDDGLRFCLNEDAE